MPVFFKSSSLVILALLLSVTVAAAGRVCEEDKCYDTRSLSITAGVAIGITVLCVLILSIFLILYVRRTRRQHADVVKKQFSFDNIDPEQVKGPRTATTYDIPINEKVMYGASTNPNVPVQTLAYSNGYDDLLKGASSAPNPGGRKYPLSATRAKFGPISRPVLKHSSRSYVGSRI